MNEKQTSEEDSWDLVLGGIYGLHRNTTLEKAIIYTVELFNKAKQSIWIVAGNLDRDLWDDPNILLALNDAADRNVEIRIVFGPSINSSNEGIRKLHQEGKLHLHRFPTRPEAQFIVVDEKHVRVEEFHMPGGSSHRAWVKHNTTMLGSRLACDFRALLSQAQKLSVEDQP